MTHVYFVRHAEPNYENHDDKLRELTEKGLKDRNLVTEYLKDKKIDVVLSSPYRRAVETITPFAESRNLPVQLVNNFRERRVGGAWIEDFDVFCKRQWDDFSYKLFDGEALADVQARNIIALENVLTKYEGKNIIVGSHGTALSVIINFYDNSYGYDDFMAVKSIMPWVVKFVFHGKIVQRIEKINPFIFSGTETGRNVKVRQDRSFP